MEIIENLSDVNDCPEELHKSLFTSKSWLNLLHTHYGFPVKILNSISRPAICAGVEINKFGQKRIISLPFSDYTIPNIDSPETFNTFIKELNEVITVPFEISFRLPEGIDSNSLNFPFKENAVCHTVNTSSQKVISTNFHNSFERSVRKAKKNGLKTNHSTEKKAIDRFYSLYHDLRIQKFRKLPQPLSWFYDIWSEFINNGKGFTYEVIYDETVISSAIVLTDKEKFYYKYGASSYEFLSLRPNNILFNDLFILAAEQGVKAVDLGLSGLDESYKGLRRFKSQMGGNIDHIYSYRFNPVDYDSTNQEEFGDFTSKLTQEIVEMDPDPETTSRISEILYPYFG